MAITDVTICKRALLRLGHDGITSFEDGSSAATLCQELYDDVRNMVLTAYAWHITKKKRRLSALSEGPLNEWTYAYQLPSDRITDPIAVYDSTGTNINETTDYEIIGDQIHTDHTVIIVEYQYLPDENVWPGYLRELMIKAMRAELAYPITDQANLADLAHRDCWGLPGERRQGGYFAVAKGIESRTAPSPVVNDYSLVEVRN